jgi:2-polyprenyl-3-methyl-5-hydroxy-6-metoxy-1,4-benzoquinol methylase
VIPTLDLHELPDQPFQRHPWEVARARFFRSVLARHGALAGARRVLDVGAGDGYLAHQLMADLPAGSTVVCFDPLYKDSQLTGLARSSQVSFTREAPAGPFDVILLLDVIEHVEDDRALLERSAASLAPGGCILVSVPAWASLYTRHDLFLGHHRRYRPAQLGAVMTAAGLRREAGGGLFHSLLLVRAAEKLAELGRGLRSRPEPGSFGGGDEAGVGQWKGGAAMTRAIGAVLALDNQASAATARLGWQVPGLSAWALCRKP